MDDAAITGLGYATPSNVVSQELAADAFANAFAGSGNKSRWVHKIFSKSRVARRSLASPLRSDQLESDVRRLWDVPTAERMRLFRELAPPLAAQAARSALREAGRSAEEVTHLIVVTSTGAYLPGPDVDLIGLLGLSPGVERTLIQFMGCSAAFNGLRLARLATTANPRGCTLLVCVELSSLHLRLDPDPENIIGQALFGDGAAAAVVESVRTPERVLVTMQRVLHEIVADSKDEIRWEIGDRGFEIHLSRKLPDWLGARVEKFAQPLLQSAESDPSKIDFWGVHPGGSNLLDRVQCALQISDEALEPSRAVLREFGNVASPAILFVLGRQLAAIEPGARGILLGFGPGLTLEAIELVRGAAQLRLEEVGA